MRQVPQEKGQVPQEQAEGEGEGGARIAGCQTVRKSKGRSHGGKSSGRSRRGRGKFPRR